MWQVRQLEDRGWSLVADGEVLSRTLHAVDWAHDPVQIEVCDQCGARGCAEGGYVSLRRVGEHLVLLPDDELGPPAAVFRRGVPLIPLDLWHATPHDALPPLRWAEAWRVAQREAPHELLGPPGSDGADLAARVIATDPWVEDLAWMGLRDRWAPPDALVTLARAPREERVSVFLDEPLAKVPLFVRGPPFGLYVRPGFALRPDHRVSSPDV